MEFNIAYNCINRSDTDTESNVYEMPEKVLESREVAFQRQEDAAIKKEKKGFRFNFFITIFAVISFLLTLTFLIFFLVHYSVDQPHEIQQNVDIDLLEALLNTSYEKNQLQEAELENIQHIIQIMNNSNQNNRQHIQQLEQQLNLQSCKYLPQNSSSEYYNILTKAGIISAYCDTSPRGCSCNTTGGWMRVANLDMRDPTQQCPDGFKLRAMSEPPLRTCGRPGGSGGCVNTSFPVNGAEYSRVCGRIVGYQIGSPSGFDTGSSSIDSHYIAGISLTHGSPRQHIWSLVNAQGEGFTWDACPCISEGSANNVPSFVGNDYFCDSAIRDRDVTDGVFYPGDPLWDGRGCGSGSTCCEFNNPPWFCKQLPQPTTNDIEMRICENSSPSDDDSPFEVVELYIN